MTISAEAMSQYLSGVSDSVKTATSDLQGSQSNLMEDLQTIGEYFRTHGGRQGLDAYMEANFSQAELTKFKEVTGQGPGGAPR